MSSVERQIQHARRRLTLNLLFHYLALGMLMGASIWALGVLVVRATALEVDVWLGVVLLATSTVLTGLGGTLFRRPTPLGAALALDTSAGLKERYSTALVLARSSDPFAQAALHDAEHWAARIRVPEHIRYRPPQWWQWSTATLLTALLLVFFMPTLHLFEDPAQAAPVVPQELVRAEQLAIQEELNKQMAGLQELAQGNENLADLAKDLAPLKLPEQAPESPADVRREAVKQIDNVTKQMENKLAELNPEAMSELRRNLNQLQDPAEQAESSQLSEALADGDFEGARQALEQMQQELAEAAKDLDDPASKAKLEQMQAQLDRLAQQMAKLSDSTEIQKELQNQAGMSADEAKKLADQLSQLDGEKLKEALKKQLADKGLSQQQMEQIAKKIQNKQQAQKQMQKMAKQMQKACQACKGCNNASASGSQGQQQQQAAKQMTDALSQCASQLSQLEMAEQSMNELQAALSDMQKLRNSVCQGGMKPGNQGAQPNANGKVGQQGPNYGRGIGAHIGEQKVATNFDPTKAETRYQDGAIIGEMLVDGPQVRGQVTEQAASVVESAYRDAVDAINREELPRQYDHVLRAYFERLAGLAEKPQSAPPQQSDAD